MASDTLNADLVTDANVSAWARASRSPFPHMSPYDSAVWSAFLRVTPRTLSLVTYDVALGGRSARHVTNSDGLKAMWVTLIKKRVDVVCRVGGEVWTVEVKPTANMAALGQVLTYAFLWNSEGRSKQNARPVIICSRVDEDVEAVLRFYDVLLVVVKPSVDGEPPALVKVSGSLPLA